MTEPLLRRILYTSEVASEEALSDEQMQSILIGAREFNASYDLTGMLWTDGTRFAQALEGPEHELSEAMVRIKRSKLHHNIRIAIDEAIENREFSQWTMAFRNHEGTLKEHSTWASLPWFKLRKMLG